MEQKLSQKIKTYLKVKNGNKIKPNKSKLI
jgi:hypothetical protein